MLLEHTQAKLVISAADYPQFPEFSGVEIVMVGKSNVGKSSLINALTNRKKLAYVGQTPGKTRLINFYEINEHLMLVDVPGYGFANRSKKEQDHYAYLMEEYFSRREIAMMMVLVDSRRGVSSEDEMMIEFAKYHQIPYVVILTKIDKLSKNKANSLFMKTKKEYGEDVMVFSSLQRDTRIPIQEYVMNIYNQKLAE